MRRNTRIMLFFGIVWFIGVLLYVRHSESADMAENKYRVNPKHPRAKKDEKCKLPFLLCRFCL